MEPKTELFSEAAIVNGAEFAKMIGCTFNAVKRMFGEKLTEGVSYIRDGNKIMIDVAQAKKELRATIKPSTCKNKKLLEFLDFPEGFEDFKLDTNQDWVADLDNVAVREELNKSELRLSLMQEEIMSGRYVERAVVDRQLEGMGIEIRNRFIPLSARLAPALAVAKDAREIEAIISRTIEDTLTDISTIMERDISIKK